MLIFISMARSTDFCFRTTYIGMFLCFRSIVRCFQCFVRGPSPFGKKFPVNPSPPRKLLPLNPPSPSEFPMIFRGGGMDIFWNHTIEILVAVTILYFGKIQLVVFHQCCILIGWATTRLYVIAHKKGLKSSFV